MRQDFKKINESDSCGKNKESKTKERSTVKSELLETYNEFRQDELLAHCLSNVSGPKLNIRGS